MNGKHNDTFTESQLTEICLAAKLPHTISQELKKNPDILRRLLMTGVEVHLENSEKIYKSRVDSNQTYILSPHGLPR